MKTPWLKRKIKSYVTRSKEVLHHESLTIFGKLLHDPNLLHLNRYSVSAAFSVGIFVAFLPIPFQMIVSAAFAIWVRANLPIAIALVWITNPVTTPPIFYFCYKLGAFLLEMPVKSFHLEPSFTWLIEEFSSIGKPFLLGSIVAGIFFALLANFIIRVLWRYSVIKAWQARARRFKKHQQDRENKSL